MVQGPSGTEAGPPLVHLPFEVAGVKADLDEDGAARVQVAPLDGDPGAPRQGPRGRLHPREVRRLERERTISGGRKKEQMEPRVCGGRWGLLTTKVKALVDTAL